MEHVGAEPGRDQRIPRHDVATVVAQDDLTRVVLAGTIDATVNDTLADALERAARRGLPVEVDCAAVEFIDSTGLTALVWLSNFAPDPPRLVGVPPMMAELLRLTGMDSGFRVVPS